MLNYRIRLIAIAFLAILGLVLLAGSVASAQGPAPAAVTSTATATFTPTKVVTSTVAVTSTATMVPPTATKLAPTATLVPPTATKVPPTATKVPPTATKVPPTATKVPPTATKATAAARLRTSARNAFSSYSTSINIQNIDSTDAGITIQYWNQDGTLNTSVPDTVPAGTLKFYATIHPVAPFNGSVVISSSARIASVVNIQANNFFAMASYDGSTGGGTTVYIPLLMHNNYGYNTWFSVQNAGSVDTNVTAHYSDGTSATQTVHPGAAQTFNQGTEAHSTTVFSAYLDTNNSTPILATVIEEDPNTLFAYSGFSGGSTNPVMPLINENNYGFFTGVTIQNASSTTDTQVTLSYSPSQAGTACTETQTIPHGQSKVFAQGAFVYGRPAGATSNCTLGQRFIGSAQVTNNSANMPLMATVNQLLISGGVTVMGDSYRGFDPAAATQSVVFPLIMDRNYGFWTGTSVMNIGSQAAVNCTFTGTGYTTSATLNTGQAMSNQQVSQIAPNYVGSGTCTAAAGGKLVGIVNQIMNGGTTDQFSVYEGINK